MTAEGWLIGGFMAGGGLIKWAAHPYKCLNTGSATMPATKLTMWDCKAYDDKQQWVVDGDQLKLKAP